MIQKFEIQGVHLVVDDKLSAYVRRKIGGLDRYISHHNRASAHAEVHLKETKSKKDDHCRCEVTLYLPHQTIIVKESALNMYAAIDIVEAKLKQQLQKYKDRHGNGKTHRHLFGRLRRRLPGLKP
ncbi:MAG TPA: ribosome-associated translation inhibitor RaiA [Candidatus Saccharimonadales bacterium]|nr:ribosome-associated translation inhibitor RaiA [Candidatus Saccharimonadales bacterium]